jgi:mannose-6-phosphate isomerase-like protein (cupin superfamily)
MSLLLVTSPGFPFPLFGQKARARLKLDLRPFSITLSMPCRVISDISQCLLFKDTVYSPEYQAHQLSSSVGDFRCMLISDVSGAEWGLFSLMTDAEKPMRYTHNCHYVFFIVCGVAYVTLGSSYAAVRQRVYVTPGFVFEVPRGNFYAIANAHAKGPVTIMFVKAPGLPRPPPPPQQQRPPDDSS